MNKKRILALFLVIAIAVLIFSACGEKEKPRSITADNVPKGKVLLSSLSQEELVKFLEERGVTIPEEANMDLKSLMTRMERDILDIFVMRISMEVPYKELIIKINIIVQEYYGYSIVNN